MKISVLLLFFTTALVLIIPLSEPVHAHGSMSLPMSRLYACRFADDPDNPQQPACAAAIAVMGSGPIFDWDGIARNDADSQHQQIIPDGEICSVGLSVYAGLDLPRDDWLATSVSMNQLDDYEFQLRASIPHSSLDMSFFITEDNWQPADGLDWNDLELFCQHANVPLETLDGGFEGYRMRCDLPARSGRHTVFQAWQRADSPAAYYSCIDLEFDTTQLPDALFGNGFED